MPKFAPLKYLLEPTCQSERFSPYHSFHQVDPVGPFSHCYIFQYKHLTILLFSVVVTRIVILVSQHLQVDFFIQSSSLICSLEQLFAILKWIWFFRIHLMYYEAHHFFHQVDLGTPSSDYYIFQSRYLILLLFSSAPFRIFSLMPRLTKTFSSTCFYFLHY